MYHCLGWVSERFVTIFLLLSLSDLAPSKMLSLPLPEIGKYIEQILQVSFILTLLKLTRIIFFTGVHCFDTSHEKISDYRKTDADSSLNYTE